MIDVRAILAVPTAYRLLGRIIGGNGRETYAREYLRMQPGDRVLDIGCGPGDILSYLPACQYIGLDADASYIEAARKRFGDRAEFHVGFAESVDLEAESFDVVMANGVLHHLTDTQASAMFSRVHKVLRPGGRFVTLDGCFKNDQSWIARRMLKADRGEYVREEPGYVSLAKQAFSDVQSVVRHNLLRMPYTHIILTCTRTPREV